MTTPNQSAADELYRRALAAAQAVLPDVDPEQLSAALHAAEGVYERAERARVDNIMEQTGFAGMDVTDNGVRIRLVHAADLAASMVEAFDAMLQVAPAENYREWESTVTDPATRAAIDAGLPHDQVPPLRRYTFIVVKPGGRTPHELRRTAERERDAAVAELARNVDPADRLTPEFAAALRGRYEGMGARDAAVGGNFAPQFADACDLVVQLLWPDSYGTDPEDPILHTSDPARQIAHLFAEVFGVGDDE